MAATKTKKASTSAYVAIRIDYLSSTTDIVPCTAKEDLHLEGVNGASVDLKAGEQFFLHRAGSLGENLFYVVRQVVGHKRCSCPAHKPCRHEIAVAARVARRQIVAPVRSDLPVTAEEAAIELKAWLSGWAADLKQIDAGTKRVNAPLERKAFSVLR